MILLEKNYSSFGVVRDIISTNRHFLNKAQMYGALPNVSILQEMVALHLSSTRVQLGTWNCNTVIHFSEGARWDRHKSSPVDFTLW